MSVDEALRSIKEGDTVDLIGGRGASCEATMPHQTAERRFLPLGASQDLSCVQALGLRQVIDRRAHQERRRGVVIKGGFGIPDTVADSLEPMLEACFQP